MSGDASGVAAGEGQGDELDGASSRGHRSARATRVHEDADGVGVPTGNALAWVVVAILGAVGALWFVLPGVLGMLAGSVAHLKGHRAGMPVAVASAFTTVAGMALAFWVS